MAQKAMELTADNEQCATFTLHDEDHTLGNALQFFLSKNPDVDFSGYSIPHPTVAKLNIRVQTRPAAAEVLRTAAEQLKEVCQHVLEKFEETVPDTVDA
eukprot:m51a1_g3130 putative dna-directed rna polymerases i and iii subunit rpac2-like (99) ;mRNA; f:253547-254396